MTLPAEILDQLPAEYRPSLEKFNDVPTALRSVVELEKYQGRSVAIPQANDPPEAIAKWKIDHMPKLTPVLGDMLPPAKPEDYEFKFDGVDNEAVKSDKLIGVLRSSAHKLGLSKAQAQGLAEAFGKEIMPAITPATPTPPDFIEGEAVKQLMAEVFKGEATQKIDEYKKGVMILKQSLPEIEDVLNEGVAPYGQKVIALGDHPFMVKLITEIGKLTGADFAGTNGALTEASRTAQSEIESIMHDKTNPKHERWLKGDPQVQEYMQTLWQATTGGR